jgi:CHAT domain-containing protein
LIKPTDFKLLAAALTNPSEASDVFDSDFPVKSAARISKLLLGDVENCFIGANYVYINQDDSLSGFSPHVLIDPRSGTDRYLNSDANHLNVPWLGLSYSLGMLSGSSHLVAARKLNYKNVNSGAMLGVGAPILSGDTEDGQRRSQVALRGVSNVARGIQELENLPDTKDELEVAKSYYPSAKSQILLGKEATELTLRKKTLRQEDLLIFATQGLIREEISGLLEPALVLTPNLSTSEYDDGLFTASDISRLDLSTNLVILSACNSAKFELDLFATEAASLSTAFFLAGSKSTLASLWSVNSEATSLLMKNFNKIYSTGSTSVAESLKKSMLQLARSDSKKYSHPKYWASFVPYGDPSVLFNLNPEMQGFRLSIVDNTRGRHS